MRISKGPAAKRDSLNIRIQPQMRSLIDRAAALVGKNRTDFMLDAARQAAETALLDRAIFAVDPKAYEQFINASMLPARRARYSDPMACAVSSITGIPRSRAKAQSGSMSAQPPNR